MSYLTDLIERRNYLADANTRELDPRTKAVRAALIAAIDQGIAKADHHQDEVPDVLPLD